jgi:ABC-type sugar transport system substrate-binding protein
MAKKLKLVTAFLTADQEFQVMQAEDARHAAARLGLEIEVVFADNNGVAQIQQLFRYVHRPEEERPAAIIVESVTGNGLERVARNAASAGIGWVLLNRKVSYLQSLHEAHPQLPISMVTADQLETGRIQGRQLRALLPDGGFVLYIQGPSDTSAAQERLQGMQEAIAGHGIETKVLVGDWTEKSGDVAVTSWLRLKSTEGLRLDLVAAQNDAMAIGARKALSARRPEWAGLPFTGVDGLPEGGQRLVRAGTLAATVIMPSNAGPAVNLVAAHLRSGRRAPLELVLAPSSYPPGLEDGLPARARKAVPAAVESTRGR